MTLVPRGGSPWRPLLFRMKKRRYVLRDRATPCMKQERNCCNVNDVLHCQVSELLLQDRMGFPEFSSGPSRLGWLVNLNTVCG